MRWNRMRGDGITLGGVKPFFFNLIFIVFFYFLCKRKWKMSDGVYDIERMYTTSFVYMAREEGKGKGN